MEYLIVFQRANFAIKAEQILLEKKLQITVLPLPSHIQEGCGICLKVAPGEIEIALSYLQENHIDEIRLFSRILENNRFIYNEEIYNKVFNEKRVSSIMKNCTSGGCGAKVSPGELSKLLNDLPVLHDDNLIVGYDSSDDASVYRINDECSILTTVDFFPPMVDNPKIFGRIAAANALSDIYAMGGKPLTALNFLCFPQSSDMEVIKEILTGGAEKVMEASAVIAGGHSIYDRELKYGLSVTGIVENSKIIRNNTPEVSHKLILTKPLGTGLIMAALRGEAASATAVKKAIVSMERLNKYAAEKAHGFSVSACTDITGFGLLVHALEMASDKVSILIHTSELPYFDESYQYANDYLVTSAGQRNRNHTMGKVDVNNLPFAFQELLFDPQTSGGLLLSVSPEQANDLLCAIKEEEPEAKIIGEIINREKDVILFNT